MAAFVAANMVMNSAAAASKNHKPSENEQAAELNYLNHCIQKANEKKHREEIRFEFRKKANQIQVAENIRFETLTGVYKSLDPQAKDDFIKHEVDSYLSPCGCCYPGPSKMCTIL